MLIVGLLASGVLIKLPRDLASGPATSTGDTVVEFSSVPVGKEPVAARPYLNKYGLLIDNMVPEGSEIVVEGYRAKDGSARANGRDITYADGKKLFMGSSGDGAPDGKAESKSK